MQAEELQRTLAHSKALSPMSCIDTDCLATTLDVSQVQACWRASSLCNIKADTVQLVLL